MVFKKEEENYVPECVFSRASVWRLQIAVVKELPVTI